MSVFENGGLPIEEKEDHPQRLADLNGILSKYYYTAAEINILKTAIVENFTNKLASGNFEGTAEDLENLITSTSTGIFGPITPATAATFTTDGFATAAEAGDYIFAPGTADEVTITVTAEDRENSVVKINKKGTAYTKEIIPLGFEPIQTTSNIAPGVTDAVQSGAVAELPTRANQNTNYNFTDPDFSFYGSVKSRVKNITNETLKKLGFNKSFVRTLGTDSSAYYKWNSGAALTSKYYEIQFYLESKNAVAVTDFSLDEVFTYDTASGSFTAQANATVTTEEIEDNLWLVTKRGQINSTANQGLFVGSNFGATNLDLKITGFLVYVSSANFTTFNLLGNVYTPDIYKLRGRTDEAAEINLSIHNKFPFYGLESTIKSDFFNSTQRDKIVDISNTYLNNIGIKKGIDDDQRTTYLMHNYSKNIDGFYYQNQFYIQSINGTPTDFDLTRVFARNSALGNSIQLAFATVSTELIETNLWLVTQTGIVDAGQEVDTLFIGSQFGGASFDLVVSGFSSYTQKNPFTAVPKLVNSDYKIVKEIHDNYVQSEINKRREAVKFYDNTVVYYGGDSFVEYAEMFPFLDKLIAFKRYYNIAKAGAGWAHNASTVLSLDSSGSGNNVIWNQVNKLIDMVDTDGEAEPDVFFVHCGTNNSSQGDVLDNANSGDLELSIRTEVKTTWAITDYIGTYAANDSINHTITGGMRYAFDTLLARFPKCKIIMAGPAQRANLSGLNKLVAIQNLMDYAAKYAAVPCINTIAESGVYFVSETNEDIFLSSDNLHPKAGDGGEIFANLWVNNLKKILIKK